MLPDFFFWLKLEQTPGVGAATARQLLQTFGLPAALFEARFESLEQVVGSKLAAALQQAPSPALLALTASTERWCDAPGHSIMSLADADYPPALLAIPDPPLLLYIQGQRALLSSAGIGVVGSRHASVQGRRDAEQFATALSHAGLTITSGLASGIDGAAHQAALRASGATIAVVGSGADIVYPASHRRLASEIAERGAIVSQYSLGTPPQAANFPRRNRLISGLSQAILVIEAAAQSGSLITARMALEQGRDVFAVPGSIHSPLAKGCHQLIKQGAKLVESVADILEELPPHFHAPPARQQAALPLLDAAGDQLLALLSHQPISLDALVQASALSLAELHAHLLELELAGMIESLPGLRFRRLA
ncbi:MULTISPECIES: DNA-processing protein DprA [unclassified Undibacterium]|uniref:DNA-processing protein DprA n=1 Tax=unclassified Undibacterium TaxID=2630295 RepID=UPI002AC9D217|nr:MULTISPECIES: DNA-processing protein DprA [unclassified Undibacterium]MEB0137769.1 DNA-processing protein DprA [Undibacterium sp. CCC2.1]MEB0171040.1 DNA-processing protein DprA [Undibacterium sp. CCC1.1]MEB0175085.1 DNA-processing protein DprA [Undibacterium sp. CCC3.4]MEB0215137.1 DNA-processing protein DprA [Undibacterium sp. 5I2]WPX44889.1 DNA-processing protein DprA [Undibacterium sp. CCC3.4]